MGIAKGAISMEQAHAVGKWLYSSQGIYNVSTTSTKTTQKVLSEIESVLETIGIKYEKEKWV